MKDIFVATHMRSMNFGEEWRKPFQGTTKLVCDLQKHARVIRFAVEVNKHKDVFVLLVAS